MASVQDLGFGKFKVFVELGYDDRGKRIRRTKTINATSERDLKNQVRDFEIKCFNEKDEPVDNINFLNFAKKWEENHVIPNLKKTSRETYRYTLYDAGVMDHFGKMKMKNIKRFHIVEFLAKEEYEGNTLIPSKYMVLKSIFAKAVEWEVIKDNPTSNVKGPKQEKGKVDFYNEEELNHLFTVLDDCNDKYRIMIKLASIGGLRRSEILGVREESIDYEENTIYVDRQLRYDKYTQEFYLSQVKNNNPRTVYFPKGFMRELKTFHTKIKARKMQLGNLWKGIYDDNNEMINLLFVKDDGYPAHLNTFGNEWNKIIKRHGLKKVTLHQLRHSCASLMVKKGINFKVIQERLGHANIGITLDLYSHLEKDQHIESTDAFNGIL